MQITNGEDNSTQENSTIMMEGVFSQLSNEFQEKLASSQINKPTKVQENVIPEILKDQNVIFQSETGTGKTLAYLLPVFEKMKKIENTSKQILFLICTPTFELASQIKQNIQHFSNFKAALFIGGSPIKRQAESLKEKPEIVIGTPARLVELIRLKKLKTSGIRFTVFDEVDRLLKKELIDEIKELTSLLPENNQLIACSATIDDKTKRFFHGSKEIILPQENVISQNITHWAIYAENRNKIETLRKLLNALDFQKVLIFTSRADQVENIYTKLRYKKINCSALHAKTDKQMRKAVIDRFRSGKEKILITSDLSARGLDIQGISHIIQMDLPNDNDFFIHRSGRTARAGNKGINIVIGDEYEMRNFSLLEKKLKIKVYPKEIRDGKIIEPRL